MNKKKLLKKQNVNGFYVGTMKRAGENRGTGLVVTVTKKEDASKLNKKDLIPKEIDGMETDVIEVGELKALAIDRTAKHRPFPMGVSVGHIDITAGTAGCLVRKGDNTYLLSNNHVLANVNEGALGDPILQPGKHDGGTIDDAIGNLHDFVHIDFGTESCTISKIIGGALNLLCKCIGSSVRFTHKRELAGLETQNKVDCAIAELLPNVAIPQVVDLGLITGTAGVSENDEVWKSGRTTEVQSGPVSNTNYTAIVNMGEGRMATFEDQLLIQKPGFSAGGDSGSTIHKKAPDGSLKIVGLLFAGSEQVTIGNKIGNVFSELGVSL